MSEHTFLQHDKFLLGTFSSNCGGGMMFAWIDEWFKRTWIVDPMDYDSDQRIRWHNVTSPEQNFGLLGYKQADTNWDDSTIWKEEFGADEPITSIQANSDFSYLRVRLNTNGHLGESETLWLSLDTYNKDLGESILPQGQTMTNRPEFVLRINNNSAELYVTEAYDLFAIWHHETDAATQKLQSIASDGKPWKIVRWKNNTPGHEVQYIGSMGVNRLNIPVKTTDAVILKGDYIEIKIPWTLLNITDPSRGTVVHRDGDFTPYTTDRTSDGINFGIAYNDFKIETSQRYVWDKWERDQIWIGSHIEDNPHLEIYEKESFKIMREKLVKIPGKPIAKVDTYKITYGDNKPFDEDAGLLKNDISLDGADFKAVIVTSPKNGIINLSTDGSFDYTPVEGFTGIDTFQYRIDTEWHSSEAVTVTLNIEGVPTEFITLYPNPVQQDEPLNIVSKGNIDYLEVYNSNGQKLFRKDINSNKTTLSVVDLPKGIYFILLQSGKEKRTKKIIINK